MLVSDYRAIVGEVDVVDRPGRIIGLGDYLVARQMGN